MPEADDLLSPQPSRPRDSDAPWRDWHGHIVVCGLDDVGVRLVEQLRLSGEQVVVVDDAPEPRRLNFALELGAAHLAADARRPSTLESARVDTAAAIICAEPSDLENLEVALLAKRLQPSLRVVVQLGNPALGRAVGRVTGPDSVLDTAAIAAPTLAEACLDLRSRPIDLGRPRVRAARARRPARRHAAQPVRRPRAHRGGARRRQRRDAHLPRPRPAGRLPATAST